MDLGTVVGLVLTLALLAGAMAMGVGVGPYIDVPSILIVFGGTTGALLTGFKMEQMKNMVKIFMIAIKPPQENVPELIKKMVDYSTKARRDGILALENDANNESNAFLRKGLSMAVDGNEPDNIRDLLEIEMEQTSARHKSNADIFDRMAGYAGSMGMIGTLIGLVAMLLNMADPSAIGPAMAVALLTTMYGAMIGNIVGSPVNSILLIRDSDETLAKTLILQGIMAIQAGDNPRTLEAKLLSFLPPNERTSQFE
ncbi:MAG: MotA/TolQ/ExbB proton channel family protein [Campylobacterales bacterium]|nr:MotA/TolQ/ExbB proton channel family protein [Campylobacterales bacterium]